MTLGMQVVFALKAKPQILVHHVLKFGQLTPILAASLVGPLLAWRVSKMAMRLKNHPASVNSS